VLHYSVHLRDIVPSGLVGYGDILVRYLQSYLCQCPVQADCQIARSLVNVECFAFDRMRLCGQEPPSAGPSRDSRWLVPFDASFARSAVSSTCGLQSLGRPPKWARVGLCLTGCGLCCVFVFSRWAPDLDQYGRRDRPGSPAQREMIAVTDGLTPAIAWRGPSGRPRPSEPLAFE
jgi:hypothetical protein